jgi:Zn-dependent protease
MPHSQCSRCLAPLGPQDKLCPQCHALVYATELESLSAQALEYERQGQPAAARQLWMGAQQLLPPGSTQAQWIAERLRNLTETAPSPQPPPAQQKPRHPWVKWLGPLAPLAIVAAKFKSLVFALFKLKFLFSFAAFLGVYWALYGAWFGAGFAAMILLHEMGHFVEIKRRGLPADMPVFLPGLGAYVKWQGLGVTAETRALISLAGPAAGLLSAWLAALLYWRTGNPLWAALAHTGAWLNLLNLIPIWELDGAGAVRPLDAMGRIGLLAVCALLFWWGREGVLLLLAAGFGWQLYRKEIPAQGALGVQLYFAAILACLAWLLRLTPLPRP